MRAKCLSCEWESSTAGNDPDVLSRQVVSAGGVLKLDAKQFRILECLCPACGGRLEVHEMTWRPVCRWCRKRR